MLYFLTMLNNNMIFLIYKFLYNDLYFSTLIEHFFYKQLFFLQTNAIFDNSFK